MSDVRSLCNIAHSECIDEVFSLPTTVKISSHQPSTICNIMHKQTPFLQAAAFFKSKGSITSHSTVN